VDTRKPTIDEIHRRVGRNLLDFQTIEQALRFILPFVHPDGSKKGGPAMRKYRKRRVKKKSLGLLVGQFNEAVSSDRELIELELQALVDARNVLVHRFHSNEHFDLTAPNGAAAAIAYLDEQHERFRDGCGFFAHTQRRCC
jgi:hypothetical protein